MSDELEWPEGWRWYRNPTSHGGEPYLAHPHDCELTLNHIRRLVAFHGLALVPAADVPTPISDETLRHLTECALAWEPEARVIGDVTAHQLRSFCLELARLRRENPEPECDNCGAVIDGHQAATSDVCFDCWRSAKERACTPEERAVLEAMAGANVWRDKNNRCHIGCGVSSVAQAELARRAAPAATGVEPEKPAARVIDLFEALKQALEKADKEQGT